MLGSNRLFSLVCNSLVIGFVVLPICSSVFAQSIKFPNSSSESQVKKVQSEIFENFSSQQLLKRYLSAANKRGLLSAAEAEIGLPQYIEKMESWLKSSRGVTMEWPENAMALEKAKFLTDMVQDIRPYNRSVGNRELGLNIEYFRSEEMAEYLSEVYGEEVEASIPELKVQRVVAREVEVTEKSSYQPVGRPQLLKAAQNLDEAVAAYASQGIVLNEAQKATLESMMANGEKALLVFKDLANNNVFPETVKNDEAFESFKAGIEGPFAHRFSLLTHSQNNTMSLKTGDIEEVIAESSAFAIKQQGLTKTIYPLFNEVNGEEASLKLIQERPDHFKVSSGELAGEIYSIFDRDYSAYLAKTESERQAREARALAREQAAAAKKLAAEQAAEARKLRLEEEANNKRLEKEAEGLLKSLSLGNQTAPHFCENV